MKSLCFSTLIVCFGAAAAAQDSGISVTIGVGPKAAPAYFGSDEIIVGPTGSFSLNELSFGGFSVDDTETYGLGYHPAFRYIGERSAEDYDELTGLVDIEAALELGAGLDFTTPDYSVYADVRYGVIGHESVVAEIGGDVFFRPSDQLTFSAGPRVLWGSDDYAATYFGVTGAEAAASSFDAFDARSGIVSAGIEAAASYQFNDNWGVRGTVRFEKLQNDAADSPISVADDQFSAGIVITRQVTFGF